MKKEYDSDQINQDVHEVTEEIKAENTSSTDELYYWYAVSVRVKSQESRLVRFFSELLTRNTSIKEVYLPQVTTYQFNAKKNKKIEKQKSAINYFFVKAVEGFLSRRELQIESNVPFAVIGKVSEQEVNKLKEYFNQQKDVVSDQNFEIKPNMIVQIAEGAFAELHAKVIDVYDVNGTPYANVMIWIIKGCEPLEHKIKTSNLRPLYDGERNNNE